MQTESKNNFSTIVQGTEVQCYTNYYSIATDISILNPSFQDLEFHHKNHALELQKLGFKVLSPKAIFMS